MGARQRLLFCPDLFYLSVTAHGVLMALVFTTFFIMGKRLWPPATTRSFVRRRSKRGSATARRSVAVRSRRPTRAPSSMPAGRLQLEAVLPDLQLELEGTPAREFANAL